MNNVLGWVFTILGILNVIPGAKAVLRTPTDRLRLFQSLTRVYALCLLGSLWWDDWYDAIICMAFMVIFLPLYGRERKNAERAQDDQHA